MERTQNARTIEATGRSLSILEALQELHGARVTVLAEHLDLSKSTIHNHLTTLREHGYVTMEGDTYHISLKMTNLGEYARNRKPAYRRARELSDRLAEETNLESGFIVEENGRGVYLKTETGDVNDPHIFPQVGDHVYLHSTAAGKAILADLPRERVEVIVDRRGLPPVTENTITDRAALFEALDRIRERGYAVNKGENEPGMRAVAVAVPDDDGTVLGGVSVSGPKYRMSGEWFQQQLPEIVLDAVEGF